MGAGAAPAGAAAAPPPPPGAGAPPGVPRRASPAPANGADPEPGACGDSGGMDVNPFTLAFRSPAMEGHYLGVVAKDRWPVLVFVFAFDCLCFAFRAAAKIAGCSGAAGATGAGPAALGRARACALAARSVAQRLC